MGAKPARSGAFWMFLSPAWLPQRGFEAPQRSGAAAPVPVTAAPATIRAVSLPQALARG